MIVPNKKPGIGGNRLRVQHPGCSPRMSSGIYILPRISRSSKGWFDGKRTPPAEAD